MNINNKNLLGKFNPVIDEGIHIIISLFISLIALAIGLDIKMVLIIFFIGIIVDIDHIFNKSIAKLIRAKNYKGSISYHSKGYVFKIFHGFDVNLIVYFLSLLITSDFVLSRFIFFNLFFHEIWDFLIYPHSWKELFLVTKVFSSFKPGTRNSFKGIFFNINTMKY